MSNHFPEYSRKVASLFCNPLHAFYKELSLAHVVMSCANLTMSKYPKLQGHCTVCVSKPKMLRLVSVMGRDGALEAGSVPPMNLPVD